MIQQLRSSCVLLLLALLTLCSSAIAKPNLILITLDSTRADHMGFLGANAGLTPNLDRLAAESLVFEHAYAQSPGTVVSHATILSGVYPQTTGMSEIGGTLSPSLPHLSDLLKAQGYRAAAFVSSAQLDPRNGPAQGFDRGFQTYETGFRAANVGTGASTVRGDVGTAALGRPAERSSGGRGAHHVLASQGHPDQVVTSVAAWLTRNTQAPFFLWIHLAAPHSNAKSYNAAIAAEDAAIGKLLATLQLQKLDANTAVVLASSHGESLGAHGEENHGIFLYDETVHVPLLIKLPGADPSAKRVTTRVTARVTTKVRLIDIAPTLLEIAGASVPSQMQGQSLLRIARAAGGAADQPVYSRADLPQGGFGWSPLESWRAGKYLYIRAPKPELYDLTADPEATRNLAQSSKATLDTMAAQLASFDRRIAGEAGKSSGAELSSSEMQKLASLGYVGLQKSAGASAAITGTDPKDQIATANRVIAAAEAVAQSKPDQAIVALAVITSADPNLYLAQYTMGVAEAQKGQYSEAAKHLHKAIELQPESAWAHYAMGATLLKTGDYKTAAVHLEIATTRLPAFAPAHLALAQAYEQLGRKDDAKRERNKLL